ncbi:MAG: hypothetical protein IT480_11155 [Gammaproteobacteria bacterium]|nr:hypothetical protein [Gammaproteobacteria bacterium]
MMRTSPGVLQRYRTAGSLAAIAALLWGCGPRPAAPPAAVALPSFLNARLRGAIDADLAWNDPDLRSEGGARPDGSGIRVSLAGALRPGGQRLRLVFGITAAPGQPHARAVPTNLTVILEGANRVYATLGDDRCTIDALAQQPIAPADPHAALAARDSATPAEPVAGDYQVDARGFCIAPAATLDGTERLLLSRFDFRARIRLETADLHAPATAT